MKYVFIAVVISVITACSATKSTQPKYTTTMNGEEKILTGYINSTVLNSDTSFKWFKENRISHPDAAAVEAFKNKQQLFEIIVFGGTWCHDTQNLLPVFYSLVEKSGYPESKITLVGVDRSKKTINNLHTKYDIKNVPTFIVMKDGKEVGRVVEYGKYGAIDKELGEIVAAL